MAPNVFPDTPDVSLLVLDEATLSFFQTQTGIFDEEALRNHIITVASEALKSHPYPCFRSFRFVLSEIKKAPWYKSVIDLGLSRQDALLLDVGCGLGDDLRRLAADGYPAQNMIGTDIVGELWDIGHKLFCSSDRSFPARFIQDDVTKQRYTSFPFEKDDKPSLADLAGRISVIHTSYLFHMFTHEQQLQIARLLANLVTRESQSIIFGRHITSETESLVGLKTGSGYFNMACFSPAAWERIWKEQIFPEKQVEVLTMFEHISYDDMRRSVSGPSSSSYPATGNFHWCVRLL